MKKSALLSAIAAILFLSGSTVYGASDNLNASGMEVGSSQKLNVSPNDIRGLQVYSKAGEELGHVKRVHINLVDGSINYLTITKSNTAWEDQGPIADGETSYRTLSRKLFLDRHAEDVAVPFEALVFEQEKAVLTVDASALDNVPMKANKSNQDFIRDLNSHYGIAPVWDDSWN